MLWWGRHVKATRRLLVILGIIKEDVGTDERRQFLIPLRLLLKVRRCYAYTLLR